MKHFVPLSRLLFVGFLLCNSILCFSQISFQDQTGLLVNEEHFSRVPVAISDMNGDGLDDIVRYNHGEDLNIEYQTTPNANFANYKYGAVHTSAEWSTCIGDYDQNGFNDILVGGYYDELKILEADATGSSYTSSLLPDSDIFLQGSNFIDINNDGWLDIYACHDDEQSLKWRNLGDGTFVEDSTLMETLLPTGNSGNYASIWTDYDNDGDLDMYLSKCRAGVTDPKDPRRINLLFQNDGNHTFTEVGVASNLAIGDQTWATDFADIDNDGDLDCFVLNHAATSLLMENNGDGTFTDITTTSGISFGLTGIQSLFRDFDNDGFVDLIVTGSDHEVWHNNGDKTFTLVSNPFVANDITSMAIGDLNSDGYLDVYATYNAVINGNSGIIDRMWMNDGGSNNYFQVMLEGVESNVNGIGARLELHGSWGIQVREVRSGEGYGIHNSFCQHFGLDQALSIDTLVVKWPSGKVDILGSVSINDKVTVVEGSFPDCHPNYVVSSEPVPDETFDASQTILSTGTVANGTDVSFLAADVVTLDIGFETIIGAEFLADIVDCSP